ncbi:MAG: hypothetical protein FKGGLIKP_00798 [Sodalis sp. Fse]|nr:MAG: hypothetical protein FKGGLIKP_00798 [Sodalis sp. Fse]
MILVVMDSMILACFSAGQASAYRLFCDKSIAESCMYCIFLMQVKSKQSREMFIN